MQEVEGKVAYEEHERRTLPCSRIELCERFLASDEYRAFLERQKTAPLHVSFFQKRICSCMVSVRLTGTSNAIPL